MEREHLNWINKAYKNLLADKNLSRLEMKTPDGYIAVYRVSNLIRIDIKKEETKC